VCRLQGTFAAPGELAKAQAALGAVLVERPQRVPGEAARSTQGVGWN